jgi:hypothetical protein
VDEPPPLPDPHRSPDARLREAGFVIVARPEGGPARWRRGRLMYLEADATEIAKREWQAELKRLEAKSGK